MAAEESTEVKFEPLEPDAPIFPVSLWNNYKKALTTSPLLAKSAASMFGFALGAVLGQAIFMKVPWIKPHKILIC